MEQVCRGIGERARRPGSGWRARWVAAGVVSAVGLVGVTGCGGNAFVAYSPNAELVPALEEGAVVHLGGYDGPNLWTDSHDTDCDAAREFLDWEPGPNGSEWRDVIQVLQRPDRSRVVSFATQRFATRQEFDERMQETRDRWNEDCISWDGERVVVEAAALEGLPDNSVSAHWLADGNRGRDGWATIVGDRDRQVIMIVAWVEEPGTVPTEAFVDVVTTAWSDFVSENG